MHQYPDTHTVNRNDFMFEPVSYSIDVSGLELTM